MYNILLISLVACVGTLAVLQGLSISFSWTRYRRQSIEGRSTWIAKDATVFEEFAVTELDGSQSMLHDFEVSRGEAIIAASDELQSHA